jgi:AraC-like DNA-binding protein
LKIGNSTHLLDHVYFSGLQDHFRNARISMQGRVHVLGICFFPEGFYPFLKIPVSECANQIWGAGEVGLFPHRSIHERLREAADITARLSILEHELVSFLDGKIQTPESFRQLFYALKGGNRTIQIAEFCQDNQVGMRKLERMFKKYVGISAKTYSVLNRFQDSLHQLFISDYSKLSDIAYGNDYFDQMHFIRDFKRFAGNTPKQFLRQSNSMLHVR